MKRWLLFLTYFSCIAALVISVDRGLLRPLLRFVNDLPLGDKVSHFVLVGGLAILLNYALRGRSFSRLGWRVGYGSLIVFAGCTIEEVSQLWIPHRTFDLGDMVANYLGIVVAQWILCRGKSHPPVFCSKDVQDKRGITGNQVQIPGEAP